MPLQINTPGDFGVALLQKLGAPVTKSNLQFLIAWSNEEGGHFHNGAHFNPLNTTLNEPGATTFNSVGVKAYTSWDQGVTATAATLQNGRYNDIVAALKGGDAAQTAASASSLKTWSGGGYGSILRTIPQASAAADQALANAGMVGTSSDTTAPAAPSGTAGGTIGLQFGGERMDSATDPADLSDLARILEQQADVVDSLGDGLTRQLAAVNWAGPVADSFRTAAGEFSPVLSRDADTLRLVAADLRRLADQLQQEIDQLRVVEAKVRAWYVANPPPIPAPWPASNLPPTGDPRWRDVQRAFASVGVI
jgi:uncharacterized protein YukE